MTLAAPLADMSPVPPAVQIRAVASGGPAPAATTIAFRTRGTLHVAVVIRATLEIVADAPMRLVAAEPLERGDLVPYLERADVVVSGDLDALAPVRLILGRGDETLIDKAATAEALGPAPLDAAARAALEASAHGSGGRPAIPTIPEAVTWRSFQAAPEDQRIDHVRGDEWLSVYGGGGPDPLESILPAIWAEARLHAATGALRAGRPIPLKGDTLRIDPARRRATAIWRGSFPCAAESALAALRVVVGIASAAQPIAWVDPFDAPEQDEHDEGSTLVSSGGTIPALDAAGDDAPPPTEVLPPELAHYAAPPSVPPPPEAVARALPAGVERRHPFERTLDVGAASPVASARPPPAPAVEIRGDPAPRSLPAPLAKNPFAVAAAAKAHPLGGTHELGEESLRVARGEPSTPFAAAALARAPTTEPLPETPFTPGAEDARDPSDDGSSGTPTG